MTTVLITFLVFLAVGLLMALGVIFGRKALQGSCGGLNSVGVERVCNCETTCETHRLYQISEPDSMPNKAAVDSTNTLSFTGKSSAH